MNSIRHLIPLLLALLAQSQHLLAQSGASEDDQYTAPSFEQAAEPDPAATPAPTAATPKVPTQTESPFDYRASEEISEDLSVSFPVDI